VDLLSYANAADLELSGRLGPRRSPTSPGCDPTAHRQRLKHRS
jgi:hypothetical protein